MSNAGHDAGHGNITAQIHSNRVVFPVLSYTYPLKLLSPRLQQDGVAIVYMITYGGGLVSGDCISLSVNIEQDAQLVFLSQGSTKVFKARPGVRAAVPTTSRAPDATAPLTQQRLDVCVAAGGALYLLPDPVTCFRDAAYHQIQTFRLARGASAALLDWYTSGRRARGEEWAFARYYSVNEVFVDGTRSARDVVLLEGTDTGVVASCPAAARGAQLLPQRTLADRMGPYACYATLLLYGPRLQGVVRTLEDRMRAATVFQVKEPLDVLWSLSPVRGEAGEDGRIVRVAGKETEDVKMWLSDALRGLVEVIGGETTITPHNQTALVTRTYVSQSELDDIVKRSSEAQKAWARVPLKDRLGIATKFVDEFQKMADEIPLELTLQMGRPVSQVAGEIRGTLERAKYMLSIAESSLADVGLQDTDKPGFRRFIRRTPLGVVLVIAPWNYPYLTSINSILPAIVAGNSVLLKPSPQTPLTAERLSLALHLAGLPENVLQVLHLSPPLTTFVVQHPLVDFVSFTGSVAGGHSVEKAAVEAPGFKGVALELGGKDPAYVRADADLAYTAAELVDGAFFNSGQSCCAVERIYVHESVYDTFVDKFVDIAKSYKLGDPTKSETNLGPVVSLASAQRIRKQVRDAVDAGARALIPEELFVTPETSSLEGTAYVAPQVLVDVNHTMGVMMDETFGPIVGIQKVSGDEEAARLMNDSPYGLTASIWTNAEKDPESQNAFLMLADELHTGTVFLNRCDALDPALAWGGVKDSGRGVSLSKFGYDQLTRAKSVHMKINTL